MDLSCENKVGLGKGESKKEFFRFGKVKGICEFVLLFEEGL